MNTSRHTSPFWGSMIGLCVAGPMHAQNLVPNPGFETQTSCPLVSEIEKAPPWHAPSMGTPDLFNSTCPQQNPPGLTGIGSSGVFVYSGAFSNYREYIQAPLITPLVAGQGYCISFHVTRVNYQLAADRIGAWVRSGPLSQSNSSVINATPQVENPAGNILMGTGWHTIVGGFHATGGEDHIIIGNFRNDGATQTQVANPGSSTQMAFYRIDDISLNPCAVGIGEHLDPDLVSFYPQPANDRLSITYPGHWPVQRIELLALDGRVVRATGSADQRFGLVDLDVWGLTSGMYVLRLSTAKGVVSKRVLVQH